MVSTWAGALSRSAPLRLCASSTPGNRPVRSVRLADHGRQMAGRCCTAQCRGPSMRKLTVLSVAFPFAIVSADPIGGAEQILARIDRALIEAGHHSIVLAAEGSESAGDLITAPRISGEIGQAEWNRAHQSVRASLAEAVRTRNVDLVHLHGVDFPNYLPTSDIRVLATLHLPLSYYPSRVLDPARPRTWFNAVSAAQSQPIRSHSSIVATIENGVAAPHGPAPAKE